MSYKEQYLPISGKQYINNIKSSTKSRNHKKKKIQTEILQLKNTMTEMKNEREGSDSTPHRAKAKICKLEAGPFEITQSEEKTEKGIKKNEQSLWDFCDTIKELIYALGESQRRRERGRAESLFKEITAENFPNLEKMDTQICEGQKSPNEITQGRPYKET